MNKRILLVEDGVALLTTLRDRLRKERYDVTIAENGELALKLAEKEAFDLLILDVMLPKISGLTVCEKLRSFGSTVPILMLTARRQTADKVTGLKTGADDYMTKPFQVSELLARIEALLRRPHKAARKLPFLFADVQVDFQRTEVTRRGFPVKLSAMEFQLLAYLVERRGTIVTRDEMLREIWGYASPPVSRTVDVHIAALRQKLEPDLRDPQFILTIPGVGYKFTE